jgi:hypothetical protein
MRYATAVAGIACGFALTACADPPPVSPELRRLDVAPADAGQVIQAVHGGAHIEIAGELRTFTFSARKTADGAVTGEFQIIARQVDRITHGRITCMRVLGNAAWLGVVIERDDSGVSTGAEGRFRVVDLGPGGSGPQDLVSLLAFSFAPGFAQAFCNNVPPNPPLNMTQGEVVITQPGSSSFSSSVIIPISLQVFVPCAMNGAGEVVFLSGNLHSLFHFTDDGADGFHVMQESNPQGVSGTGLTSGDKYQGTGVTLSHFNTSGIPFNQTFVNNFRIIGQGNDNNFLVHQTFHITVNANGVLTALVDNFSVECR